MQDKQPLIIQPDWLESDLSPSALFVLARLDAYWRNNHVAYPSNSFLSQQTGLNKKTVERCMYELRERGWISCETTPRTNGTGGKQRSIYPTEKVALKIGVNPKSEGYVDPKSEGYVTLKNGAGEKETENKRLRERGHGSKRGFSPPSITDVQQYCRERNNGIDPQAFVDFYQAKGWYVGKTKMKDWRAAVRTWERRQQPDEDWKREIL